MNPRQREHAYDLGRRARRDGNGRDEIQFKDEELLDCWRMGWDEEHNAISAREINASIREYDVLFGSQRHN